MTLIDTGVLVALLNPKDRSHEQCWEVLHTASRPFGTTWPCLTEALYLTGRYGGQRKQDELLQFFDDSFFDLHLGSQSERGRIRELMAKYSDAPMDFADASLVACAEVLGTDSVLTLDRHFHAYLIDGTKSFQVVP